MGKFINWVSTKVRTFWNWIKSIYAEGKSIVLSVVSIVKDPTNKVSMTRVLVAGVIGLGAYIAIKDFKAIIGAAILIGIGFVAILIKSFIEKLGKK